MSLVAGIDSSTQSCKVLICDADTGRIQREGRASHPEGTEIDPAAWESAAATAINEAGGLGDVAAVAVGAQQHGMVCLDAQGRAVRPALLWNDTRSAGAAADLVTELGGPGAWAEAVGVVPLAAITVSKLRWLTEHEPHNSDRTAAICLPHDWLSWRLRGENDPAALVTDRSDASGTGYFDAARDEYRIDLLELAMRGRRPTLPEVLAPGQGVPSGDGAVFGAGLGDNAAAALGLGAHEGDVIVSIGTSGVVSAIAGAPARDGAGFVAGFADGTGRHLPLVCTLNGARVLDAAAAMLRVDHAELSSLALSAPAGSEGLVMVPYLEGERTPNRPHATGAVHGLRVDNATAAHLARAAVEGLLCALADGLDHLTALGVPARRVLLIGGGVKSPALREIAPTVFGVPVHVPKPAEYVALGAARQAAWALTGTLPDWTPPPAQRYEAAPVPAVRERYAEVRDLTEGT
ncbi:MULTISPECIES: FGGY family carbohydrate kinase [unclassified Mycolicibacterium]|uniref:FGGY family carbohydrate kinase n=1 Tax=unclassified Mycolicibacterium TaxID=2636767 RepID=UPI0012DC5031|nr:MULTISPECIES: FGGY family carbohydrate kinase [unclassified Mycolicibacterium]MUL81953.1 xylulose kinase [Mycolicibacterium sp. CBMA 329]MUL87719.1 xylulose kinase [Mycolicibacterium sp. CBMA 331]MUL99418.1 xylulose kinase [Mycolicibacterium sp. CBMA 334]MUM29330.1 xylulose kinase [Mycolicibacterium sp. CBMA 295]MUM38016.1 xylulose kinase [Mycolicibacterium sp. CBMA 247]